MSAASSALTANLMVIGLFLESLLYGSFLLTFCVTAYFIFARSHKRSSVYGARVMYSTLLTLMWIVASAHEAITLMCATEHVRSAIPTVTLLTFQTTLYVTQVVLALILLFHRVLVHFNNLLVLIFVLVVALFASAACGYRAAYELNDISVGLNIALDPSLNRTLLYARPILGDYRMWMIAFTSSACAITLLCNGLLCFAAIRTRKSTYAPVSTGRFITALFWDSGIFITLVIMATLPAHILSGVGIMFVFENFSTPFIALYSSALILLYTSNWSFDSKIDTEGQESLMKNSAFPHSPTSPRLVPHPRPRMTYATHTDAEKGPPPSSPPSSSPFDDEKADDETWRIQLQEAFNNIPPVAAVQARQLRSVYNATGGQLPPRRSSKSNFQGMSPGPGRRASARLSNSETNALRPASKLRHVLSAEDVKTEHSTFHVTLKEHDSEAEHRKSDRDSVNSTDSYLPSLE